MRVAFSSIAWDPADDEAVARVLKEAGVEAVELAPTKLWPDLTAVPASEASTVRSAWEARGLPVVALQSLLYGRPDLRLFADSSQRADLGVHLERVFELAARLGASVLVFGSPRNRRRGQLSGEEATAIAAEFFATMAQRAHARGLALCLEPNPQRYGCDFVTSARAGLELVTAVGHPGFRLHLDAACMTLAGDQVGEAIRSAAAAGVLCHFHVSEPDLQPVGGPRSDVDHEACAMELRASGYQGFVSVEMRPPDAGEHKAIAAAAAFAVGTYHRGG